MRLLIIGILMGFPLLEGTVLYNLAAGPSGHGGWVLAWLAFAASMMSLTLRGFLA